MAPKRRSKKGKQKVSTQCATSSAPDPAPAPAPAPAPPPSPSEYSFSILYTDGDLAWNFDCEDASALAKTAVEKATTIAVSRLQASLGISAGDFQAFASFPTGIGEREFCVKEWLLLGRQPFINVYSKPNTGLLHQRNEAKAKVQEVQDAKESLVKDSLELLSTGDCKDCSQLRAEVSDLRASTTLELESSQQIIQKLTVDVESLEKRSIAQDQNVLDLQKVIAAVYEQLQTVSKQCSQLFVRMVIQDARKKVVSKVGGKTKDISNFHNYFHDHESDMLAFGVSPTLLRLLKDGTWGLNQAAHSAPNVDKAHAMMTLDGALREAFKEAFEFAYDESVDAYWLG